MKRLKKFQKGGLSVEGFRYDSPDKGNAVNYIGSGNISMQGVPHPVLGQDNLGHTTLMYPGTDYQFPGSVVKEVPIKGGWDDNNGYSINLGKFTASYDPRKWDGENVYQLGVNIPIKQNGGALSPEDVAISKVLMERNRGKNFVDRAFNNDTAPRLQTNKISGYQNEPNSQYSTELMAYDNNRVYPEIVQKPGNSNLTYLGGDKAYDYADSTGQYITTPTSKIAETLSNYGYKKAAGIPIGYQNGGQINPPIYTNTPNDPRIQSYNDSNEVYNSYLNYKNALTKQGYSNNLYSDANQLLNKYIEGDGLPKTAIHSINPSGSYNVGDEWSAIVNKTLPDQIYNSKIKPNNIKEYDSDSHISLPDGWVSNNLNSKLWPIKSDVRQLYDYSNAQPHQPIIYQKPVVDNIPQTNITYSKSKAKNIVSKPVVSNTNQESPNIQNNQSHQKIYEWLHYHNNETPILDSTKVYQQGGQIDTSNIYPHIHLPEAIQDVVNRSQTAPMQSLDKYPHLNRLQQIHDSLDNEAQNHIDNKTYYNENTIQLHNGNFRGANVDTGLINDIVASAKRKGVNPWTMLGVAGQESTLGANGYFNNDQQQSMSGWNAANGIKPQSAEMFLADHRAPGVVVNKNNLGVTALYDNGGIDSAENYLQQHPQLVDNYRNTQGAKIPQGKVPLMDLTADMIAKKGVSGYNPGDPDYSNKVNKRINELKSDPTMQKFMKGKGKMQQGGPTQSMRDNYENAMGWMQSNGYNVNDPALRHNPSIGTGYLNAYNQANPGKQFNPANVPQMQQYFQDNANSGQVRTNDSRGFSPVDNFPGDQTLNSRQMLYQTQNGNTITNFGTNQQGAAAMVNSWKQSPVQTPQWQSNTQGIPIASNTSIQKFTGTPKAQKANYHTGQNTDYSIDSARQDEGFAQMGGMIINDTQRPVQPAGKYWNGKEWKTATGSTMNGTAFSQYGGEVDEMKTGGIHIKKSEVGSLHKHLGVPQGEKIPASKLAIHPGDSPAIRKKKQFAINAKKFHYQEGGPVYSDIAPIANDLTEGLIGAGIGYGQLIQGMNAQKDLHGYQQAHGGTESAFRAQELYTQGDKGDYSVNTGTFRPEEQTPVGANLQYPRMAYGGAIPGTMGTAFDAHSWGANPNTMYNVNGTPDPYTRVSTTLPEAEDGMGNVNAEKNEQVLGNFTQDGMPALMNVDGPPHTQGGKDVVVPEGSFIFSDTKSLKIKNPDILKLFNETKPQTPADIASKYRLQKFTKILSNPDSDQTEKKTAQMMVDNYSAKLQQLASVQEGMKQMKGLGKDNSQLSPVNQYGGYQQGGNVTDQWNWNGVMPEKENVVSDQRINERNGQPSALVQLPSVPDQATDLQPVPVPGNNLGSVNTPSAGQKTNVPFTSPLPDKLGMADSLFNLANIHKYNAWEAPIGAVVPNTVFMDPTRALAANSEAANSAGYNSALSGNSRANRATQSAIQGSAGENAANILAKFQGENVGISNRAGEEAANISNRLQGEQAQRLNRIYQGDVIANQQYDNAQKEGRNDLTRQAQQSWKDRQAYDLLNKTSPYYYIDPNTGARTFKSKEAEANFNNQVFGRNGNYSPDVAEKVNSTYQNLLKQPAYQSEEGKKRALILAERMNGLRETERVSTQGFSGTPKESTESGIYAGPQKFGGHVRKFGGMTNSQLKKFMKGGIVK